jgi:hypothetical protein
LEPLNVVKDVPEAELKQARSIVHIIKSDDQADVLDD